MEVLFGIIASGCLGYLITELNTVQSDVKLISKEIFEMKLTLEKIRTNERRK